MKTMHPPYWQNYQNASPPINLSLHSLVAERVHWQKGATLIDNCCSCYFVHHNELCCVVSQWFSNVSGQGPLNWHKLDQEPQLDKIIVLLQKAYKKNMTQRVIPSVIVLLMDTIWVKVNDHLRPKWCLKSFLGYQQKFANNFCPVHLCESDQGSVLHNGRDCLTALTDI